MKLLESKILNLPTVYLINSKEELKDLPLGIPYIMGDEEDEPYIVRLLEYEILYAAAIRTGYPFNWGRILEEAGFYPEKFGYAIATHSVSEEGNVDDFSFEEKDNLSVKEYIRDCSVYVDLEKLKNLHIIPVWFQDSVENAIKTNLANFLTYNPNLYNKKLGGMYGAIELSPGKKNLVIIDISGSIPRGVSSALLTLSKNLVSSMYADLLITGTKSTLYSYENIHELNPGTIYTENGMNNDQSYFKKLVTGDVKDYNVCIAFGDDHCPSMAWKRNEKYIPVEKGKVMNKWNVDKVISFHTTSDETIAGYASWFSPKEIEHVTNWVKYF